MELKQSFLFSVARVSLTLYEQRLLVRIVEAGQVLLRGVRISDNLRPIAHNMQNVKFSVPISDLLDDGSKHYELAQEAARRLMSRTFEYYDTQRKTWTATPLIYNVQMVERSGIITFYCSKAMLDVLFDFSKGFSAFRLEKALMLPSAYSMRFYALLCNQSHPITFTIEELKTIFDVKDKYTLTADFIRKVVEPSRLALDDARCNSFTYNREKEGQKVVKLTFFPVKNEDKDAQAVLANVQVRGLIEKHIYTILASQLEFSSRELSSHKLLFVELGKRADALEIIQDIAHRSLKKGMGKGYVINAIKRAIGFNK